MSFAAQKKRWGSLDAYTFLISCLIGGYVGHRKDGTSSVQEQPANTQPLDENKASGLPALSQEESDEVERIRTKLQEFMMDLKNPDKVGEARKQAGLYVAILPMNLTHHLINDMQEIHKFL